MFSLRRFLVPSCQINCLARHYSSHQGQITPRAISPFALSSRKKAATASFPIAIQRRSYNYQDEQEDSDLYTHRPRVLGLGTAFSSAPHRASDGRPLKPTPVLYVGNLQFDVTEEAVREFFESVAPVHSVRIIHDVRGMSKGFGYVDFGDVHSATKAADMLHNTLFAGRRLNIQYLANPQGSKRDPNPPSKTLFIGNMNYDMTDEDINELFKDVSNCLDIRVAMDRRSGKPRGFAHADFVSVEAASAAKEKLEGRLFFGRALRVDFSSRQRDEEGRLLPEGQ